MKIRTMLLTSVFTLSAGASFALTTDKIIADLKAEGFTRIEIKTGPTQVKAEAIRGTEKQEIVYDAATGKVLKLEIETVEEGDDTNPGIEVEEEDRDFVGNEGEDNPAEESDDEDDSEDDDSEDDDSDDDDSEDDNSGDDDSGDDDSGDDNSGDDNSGDDDSGDDNSGDDDSGDDDSGDDDSGDDDSGDDDSGDYKGDDDSGKDE